MRIWLTTLALALVASSIYADPLTCNLTAYKAAVGLIATVSDNTLAVTWSGEGGAELRLRFAIDGGTPTIRELAVRKKGGQWSTLVANVTPEFTVVLGHAADDATAAAARFHSGTWRQGQPEGS